MKDIHRVKIKLSGEQNKEPISKSEILVFIVSVVTILYAMLNAIYVVMYKNSCERFYGIPQDYFQDSIDKKLVDIFLTIIVVLIFVAPILLKKYNEKNLNSDNGVARYIYFISPLVGFYIGVWNIINLSAIIDYEKGKNIIINYFNDNAEMTIFLCVLFGIVSIVGVIACEKINSIKNKLGKGFIWFICVVSIAVSILLTIFGVLVRFAYSVEDKKNYEFIEYEQNSYAVITHYNENVLVVEYEEDDGNLYLHTNEYFLYPETVGKYTYKQFVQVLVK